MRKGEATRKLISPAAVLAKERGTRACPPSSTSSSTPPIQFHLSVGVVDYRGREAETRGMPWRGRPSLPARPLPSASWPRHLDGDGNVYRRSHEIGWFTGYYLGRSPLTINFAAMRERTRAWTNFAAAAEFSAAAGMPIRFRHFIYMALAAKVCVGIIIYCALSEED